METITYLKMRIFQVNLRIIRDDSEFLEKRIDHHCLISDPEPIIYLCSWRFYPKGWNSNLSQRVVRGRQPLFLVLLSSLKVL